MKDPPKFTQIWIFGFKIYLLATLVGPDFSGLGFFGLGLFWA
jgi:hypothetical protein